MDARDPNELERGAREVVHALRAAGYEALWAGGCVRDLVLGRVPKDYDVATSATPDQVMACFAKSIPVGAAFGVVRVLLPGLAHEYEVATFRADLHYVDGRRPTGVRWAAAREDALRRDFTINGMFLDPFVAPAAAGIIDYVGGREDLERKVVRAIGDPVARFGEDYLRLVRAVRFAARLGFSIDGATWDAMVAMAPRAREVSAERTKDELDKILGQGHADRGVALLHASGLLAAVLPEATPSEAAAEAALTRLARVPLASTLAAWGALLYDHDAATLEGVALRLKSSRAFQKGLIEAIHAARRLIAWPDLSLAEQKRLARLPTFADALDIADAAATDTVAARHALAAWTSDDLRPAPLLTGESLARAGFKPGPAFKTALEAVETAQLDGAVTTPDDALAMVKSLLESAPAARR